MTRFLGHGMRAFFVLVWVGLLILFMIIRKTN